MARPPKPIDPDQSALHWLGHELRRWRTQRGLSQKTLGGLIGFSRVYISLVETAQERPAQPFVERCDHALETGGRLLAIYEHVTAEGRNRRHPGKGGYRRDAMGGWVRRSAGARCLRRDDHSGATRTWSADSPNGRNSRCCRHP